MNLPLYIAGRYLFAKKSHNVINVISAISAIGMAIGTAALVIILSVYNGFDSIIQDAQSNISPDLLISPVQGKVIEHSDSLANVLSRIGGVESAEEVVQEQIFISYEGQQSVTIAKGIGRRSEDANKLRDHVAAGEWTLHFGDFPRCAVGATLAYKTGINPSFVTPVEFWYPDRNRSISISDPTSSLRSVKAKASCTFSVNSDMDAKMTILPIETMRDLLGYGPDEASALEVLVSDNASLKNVKAEIGKALGAGFSVKDRMQQDEALYKMMKYEKAAIFLILLFVVIIIAFNIFGSLSMLIIEKKEDIGTLVALGAKKSTIRRIFIYEGWMISLLGLAAGLVIGLLFALIQQQTGLIKMPGNYLISAYPVIIKWQDLVLTAAGVAFIGYLIALLPSRSVNSDR